MHLITKDISSWTCFYYRTCNMPYLSLL